MAARYRFVNRALEVPFEHLHSTSATALDIVPGLLEKYPGS
jgi:hypothetical protein